MAVIVAAGAGKPGDRVRRLGLRRPPCRRALAREGWRIRAAVRRPISPVTCSRWAPSGQIQPVQANLRYPRFGAPRGRRRRRPSSTWSASSPSPAPQTFHAVHVEGARAAAKAAREPAPSTSCTSRRSAPTAAIARYARTKAAGEAAVLAGISRRGHPAALARVRAGGPAFQSLRRHGAHLAVPAADRRRQTQAAAGLRRRCGRSDRRACAGRASRAPSTSSAAPRSSPSASCSIVTQEWSGRKRRYLRMPFWLPSSARCSPCRSQQHAAPHRRSGPHAAAAQCG